MNLKSHQKSSGGIAIDNLMTFDGSVLFAITESPLKQGLIWVGSNDGQLHITKNSGRSWDNLTSNIKMPPWGTISNIEASQHDEGTAYISVDFHQMGNFDPYIYSTKDYGKTWKLISKNIPKSYSSFVHVVREDGKVPGILYAGTDNALYISIDDGDNWSKINNNLPPAPVYWISLQEHFDDMVIGTYGRGIYILDDISPFRELASSNKKDFVLMPIQDAYRFQNIQSMKNDGTSLIRGQNPAYGANIDFFLPDTTMKKKIIILIQDINGNQIRKIEPQKISKGVNRVMWDLRYEKTITPKLRVDPLGVDWVTYNDKGWRQLRTWDLDVNAGKLGPKVIPGKYKAVIQIDNKSFSQTFNVLKDPNTAGTIRDIKTQFEFLISLRESINDNVRLINKIEELRYSLQNNYSSRNEEKAARDIDMKLYEIESHLFDVKLTGAREDAFRNPNKIYGRLAALGSDLTRFGADFKPTNQQVEVYEILTKRLEKQQKAFNMLMEDEYWDSEKNNK